ncbi:MAG: aminotransferase class III-fold pyridoxal phosphate-dependent enzyme, partial [Halieaceae bacterium]|nr:aminotransferase class III-fold pyridoxal phosphate-dependent enzyme [Halieaceae bacterium]
MSSDQSIAEIYQQLTPGSKELAEQAIEVFPSGITHDSRFQKPYGLYIDRASGSRKWDVDGNEYIDYIGGHGGHILGHGNQAVIDAVQQSILRGTQLGGNTADEVEYGNLVKELVPCAERVRFTMSGTESTHLALRLARAYTGKSKTIRF